MDVHDRSDVLDVRNAFASNSRFDDVNLSNTQFHNVNLSAVRVEDANLSNAFFTYVNMSNLKIDNAELAGMIAPRADRLHCVLAWEQPAVAVHHALLTSDLPPLT